MGRHIKMDVIPLIKVFRNFRVVHHLCARGLCPRMNTCGFRTVEARRSLRKGGQGPIRQALLDHASQLFQNAYNAKPTVGSIPQYVRAS
jgi:hypothetical protein